MYIHTYTYIYIYIYMYIYIYIWHTAVFLPQIPETSIESLDEPCNNNDNNNYY